MLWRLTTRSLDDLFGDVVANLNRSRQLLLDAASVAHYTAANDARLRLSKQIETDKEVETQRRRQAVHDWLSAVNCENFQNDLRDIREEFIGTTDWIHNNQLFRRWMTGSTGEDRLFWLSGIPGAGKFLVSFSERPLRILD